MHEESIDRFKLTDSIELIGNIDSFDFCVNGEKLLYNCSTFSYIANELFVTKCKGFVYAYEVKESGVNLIAKFTNYKKDAYIQVTINNKIYTIDLNCEVT